MMPIPIISPVKSLAINLNIQRLMKAITESDLNQRVNDHPPKGRVVFLYLFLGGMPVSIVISDQPYANWLAESLGYLERQNIRKLVLAGIDETNHEVVTGYFECTVSDKAGVAAAIQADALFDTVLANADRIVRQAEEMAENDNTGE